MTLVEDPSLRLMSSGTLGPTVVESPFARSKAVKTLILLLAALYLAPAGSDERPALAVVEKISGSVGFYTAEGRRIGGVKVGVHPHEIVLSPDKRYAYVSDNGILWMTNPGEGGNTISIIDLKNMKKAGVISLGNS
jgi:DNA-binding beta-propeller fold protein YncE